jgi:hypothetical protein
MKICILCKDEDVVLARENSRKVFNTHPKEVALPPIFKKDKVIQDYLVIPTSETGELPATHWFCFMNTNEESYQKIVNNSLYSTIEEAGPKEFLEKWNLKIIK